MENFLYINDIPSDLVVKGDLAIDTETTGLNYQIRDRLCVLQFSNGDGNAHLVQFSNDYSAPNLRKLLSDEKNAKIFHYARFDLGVIKKFLEVDITNVYCTKIASKLVRTYSDSHGLKELCKELLDVQLSKAQQSSDWASGDLHKEQQKYAAADVLYLHRLRDRLNIMLKRENRVNIANDCFKFLPTRVELDMKGWGEIDIFVH